MIIPRKRIRMKADAAKRTSDKINDLFTSATPELWRGVDCQFEIGLYLNDVLITDVSNIAALTLEILDAETRTHLLLTKTLAGEDLDPTLNDATWADGTKQHALLPVTGSETNIDLDGALSRNCWLVVSIVTNDSPGRSITIQASTILIVEDGTGTSAAPPDNTDNYYPKDVADARFQQIHADGASIQFKSGQHPYIYIAATGLWYPLVGSIVDGKAVVGLGSGETL